MEDIKTLREYARQVEQALSKGDATEHTHRPALQALLEAAEEGVTATNEPKRIACGAPDFRVCRGETTVGYVEAKDVWKSLDAIEKDSERTKPRTQDGEQLRRYRESLGNLVFTNYLEFRWFVDGTERGLARTGTVTPAGKVAFSEAGAEGVLELLRGFYALKVPSVGTPKELAERMARLGRMTRDLIVRAFEREPEGGTLHSQLTAFRETLIPDLGPEQFADMYAQTIAYGLFAARAMGNGGGTFTRQAAAWMLPKTNPFLRSLFNHIAGPDLDDRIAWLVDDLAQLLAEADMAAVLEGFGKRTKKEDPVVHFYETFLKEYDPKMREMRGVYYTPVPVVSYIVRSVDYLLRERFNRPLGLADRNTLVLDPAVGTGTFLYTAIKLINETLAAQGQSGTWNDYVARYLLPRVFGFELLMAPYAIAHLKLGLVLEELGYQFESEQRLGVYLTNTLEEAIKRTEVLFAQFIADEANAAARIKKDEPIMVVMGNPPYSNFGMVNKGKWILDLLEDYKKDLHEKKLNLDDDFIKFVRFGQWRIDRTGTGVLALITNNTYTDGITHRRMRECLMAAFTDIYIVNLHGNGRKGERTPDGGPDENVFDIQQGVAIGIFLKEPAKAGPARVNYVDVWGLREGKYEWLLERDIATTEWQMVDPKPPMFFFVPKDWSLEEEYKTGWWLADILPINQNGIKTDRDDLFFDFDRETLDARMRMFYSAQGMEPAFREKYGVRGSSSYDLLSRREKTTFDAANIRRCLYRPFDVRWLYYCRGLTSRPAWDVMRHLLAGENVAMISTRQTVDEWGLLATRDICGHKSVAAYDINSGFPLYLYPSEQEVASGLYQADDRRANLNPEFIADLERSLGLSFVLDGRGDLETSIGPEDVFHYAYAILHSPTYRSRYAEFLKTDFPRVPFTSDKRLFAALAQKGAELVALHLMESPALGQVVAKFPVSGTNEVEKVRYAEPDRRVWVNKTQYFEGVEPEVWGFHIGGYQVCEKWLKDRRGRKLSYDDVAHYQKVVVALKETIRLMAEIDAIIPGWPIE
ncbi:MAG: type ISP restriction/modification enzyme [Dehalococcoidia bacterium]|nr:type ISP restriction/modification enzyme [Dehalococcoidia bacterium]